jgi:diguanylate cyclase (GGDEF)-like protein
MHEALIDESATRRGRKRRLVFGFGALLILGMLFGAVFGNAMRATEQRRVAEAWHLHTLEVLLTVEAIKSAVNGGMRGERGYLVTHDEEFLEPYLRGRADAPRLVAQLAQQTGDNFRQKAGIDQAREHVTGLFIALDKSVALERAGQHDAAVEVERSKLGRNEIEAVFLALGSIEREERRLLAERSALDARAEALIENNNTALAGIGLVLLCIAAAAGVSAVRSQRRVRETAAKLRESASTDELTGIANRRSFMHWLEIEVARAERSGAPLSIAVVDLDHFKKVNDKYGHAGGDAVLRGFAELAADAMRTGDLVARLGGEEFAILMPSTNVGEAQLACERLRTMIANTRFAVPSGDPIQVTISTGIALLVDGEERDRLVTRADDALYRAKESGRNQVQLAEAA